MAEGKITYQIKKLDKLAKELSYELTERVEFYARRSDVWKSSDAGYLYDLKTLRLEKIIDGIRTAQLSTEIFKTK